MKHSLVNDPFRNPFHNRFRVPVHSRLDEMQSYTQAVWLHDQTASDLQTANGAKTRSWTRALAGAFALVVVVAFSAAFLSSLLSN